MSYVVFPDRQFQGPMVNGASPFFVQIFPDPAPHAVVLEGDVLMEHANPGYDPADYWIDNQQPQVRLVTQAGAAPTLPDRWRVNPVFLIP